ncbi:PDZ domain-containing protein [Pontibacter qinzhouensis]|uniref:PDZ domain-containing protein n=1 Tax=Pontibacter qinzhouensis TaxID=2603253 RepID=A0A5C8IK03_9BACT|nr:aspartyl protease family protein [Pontibacter qinzhouensis]TXK21973.1 PDZ domain-containing protein [Pontibacter qinzhouensis]
MTKKGLFTLVCLSLFLLLEVESHAQKLAAHDTVAFSSNRNSVILPFHFIHNLIIIPVQINDSPPLNFILDTGVKNILITHLYYTDSLNLNNTTEIEIKGLGTGDTLKAFYSQGNSLKMKGIAGENQDVYVLKEDIFHLSSRMGMPVHGIIGYDIFKNFIVKINYSSKHLTLLRPDVKLKPPKRGEVYPLHLERDKAYIFAHVRQHNGDTIRVKLVVDTGASHSLSLYLPSNSQLALPPKVMEAYLGRGLSGDINGKIGRINSFSIGRHELQNLPASYPDEASIQAAMNISDRNGNLGSDILKRFTVIFDYPHSQMTLIPNKRYKEPFNYNLAGFEVGAPVIGMKFYEVAHVVDGSPAHAVGLMRGDQILSINGQSCFEMSLSDILGYLEKGPGKKLKLRLYRENEVKYVVLTLQNRI